ncbi:MAG: hypothetical protein MUD12_17025 [Spirochaetes bacterium]|jgi:adenylate cyclase|nr:hypothetical protein [Spirochaetota bacterium]
MQHNDVIPINIAKDRHFFPCCFVFLLSFLVLLSAVSPALAVKPQNCSRLKDGLEINRHCSLLIDHSRALKIEDVSSNDMSGRFDPITDGKSGFGFTDAVFWLRCDIPAVKNDRQEQYLEIQYALMDRADFYLRKSDGSWQEKKGGYLLPFGEREIRHRHIVHAFDPSAGGDTRIYLRLETKDRMEFPLVVWTRTAFYNKDHLEQLVLGLYYGLLFVMIFYNLLIFISIRDRSYLYYVVYIALTALTMLQQNGLLIEYAPVIPAHSILVISPLCFVSAGQFILSFLNTREQFPVLHRFFRVLQCLFILPPLLALYHYGTGVKVNAFLVIISIMFIFIIGFLSLKKGYRPARYFMLAWTAVLIGVLIYMFKVLVLLPNNTFTTYAMQFGSALEVILLSLGLGDRFNAIKEEALETQTRMAGSFSRFVPHEFLEMLARESIVDVQLGDQVLRDMTVLFSDIRSFTSMSEKLTPKETIDFLNEFFGRIAPVIRAHGGFVDKYIGDAVMALFPDKPDDALDAALAMTAELDVFNRHRLGSGSGPVGIGIGIHSGALVLGTIGEKDRLETTVIADAVNTASRIEGLNKELGTRILASRDSVVRLTGPDRYSLRDMGPVKIRGKEEPVHCFEVGCHDDRK